MRYTLLGDSGLRVSELCLGTMTFGTDWGWGADEDESRKQFDLYSLVQREVERELVPMARALGLGVTAWSPLGGGLLTGKYNRQGGDQTRRLGAVDPAKLEIAQTVTDLAADLGVPPSNVALAWLRSRGGVIPILGARTAEQLLGNLGCLDVTLSAEQLARLDAASAVPLGFPHDFLASQDFIHSGLRDQLDLPPNRLEIGR